MSDINFCNTKEQLNHLGEVVTGKVDGSPTGADIDTSTLPYTGQVRKTLPALEGEYEQSITDKEVEADAAIDAYRLLSKGPYASGITLESKFEYITYNGESYFATNPPYTTTATTPDVDGNLFLGGYTTFENVANKIGNKNELSNSNFLTPSPDAITHPNATPETYVAGTQIFSGVYAGDSGCTITFIDGRVNCTAGDYKFKLPNTGGLGRVPVFTSSVSDYDGIPKTTGVNHALVADEYVVTVTPAAGNVFSVKLEQGSVATGHEVQSAKGQAYTFNNVAEMVANGAPVGSLCKTIGYYAAGDGGGADYIIVDGNTGDGFVDHNLQNELTAKLQKTYPLNAKQCGLSTSTTDIVRTNALTAAITSLPSYSYIFASTSAGWIDIPSDTDQQTVYTFDTSSGEVPLPSGLKLTGDKSILLRLSSGTTLFGVVDRYSSSSYHVHISGFSMDKDPNLDIAGTTCIDLTRCSYFTIDEVRIRTFEKGIIVGGGDGSGDAGGFYNTIRNLEVANCDTAVYSDFSFNSSKIIGGRFLSNKVGVKIQGSTNVYVSTAFEKNNLGCDVGASTAIQFTGSRFEQSGRGQGGGGDIDLITGGAILLQSDTRECTVENCWFSGASDKVINLSRLNAIVGVASNAGMDSNISSNKFGNPALDVDSNSDGVADGLTWTPTAGITPSLTSNSENVITGNKSQVLTVDSTNTVRRDLITRFHVIKNQAYTVSVRVKTISSSRWNLRCGVSATGTEFGNISLFATNDGNGNAGFSIYTLTFVADEATLGGQEFLWLNFFMNSSLIGTDSSLIIDSISISEGCQTSRVGSKSEKLIFTSSGRPTLSVAEIGQLGWCADLNRPEYWSGSAWFDSSGTPV